MPDAAELLMRTGGASLGGVHLGGGGGGLGGLL